MGRLLDFIKRFKGSYIMPTISGFRFEIKFKLGKEK